MGIWGYPPTAPLGNKTWLMVYWPPWSVKKALFLGMGWLWDVSFAPSSLGKRSHDLNHHWFPEVVSLCLYGKGKQTPTSWPEHSVKYAQVKTRRVSCHDLRVESCRRKSLHLRESVEETVSVLGTTKPTNEVRRSLLGRGTYHITRCRRRLWSHGWAVSFREARFSFFIIIQLGPLAIQPPKTQPQPPKPQRQVGILCRSPMVCMPQMAFQCHQDDSIFSGCAATLAVTMFFSSQRSQKWPLFYNKLGQLGHLSIEFDVSTGPSIWFLGPTFGGPHDVHCFFSNVQEEHWLGKPWDANSTQQQSRNQNFWSEITTSPMKNALVPYIGGYVGTYKPL